MCRTFNERFPKLPPMNKKKLGRIVTNFLQFDAIEIVTSDEKNEISVLTYFEAHPRATIKNASTDLGVSNSSIQRILKSIINLHLYMARLLFWIKNEEFISVIRSSYL